MVLDAQSVVAGFIFALVLFFLWKFLTGARSFFEAPAFTPEMTIEQAAKVYEDTIANMSNELEQKSTALVNEGNTKEAKNLGLEYQQKMSDFSMTYNKFLVAKVPDEVSIPEQAPAQAPAVSMYEPEPY